jgi:UDPglucose--hexose-1-phosphate uridylyltransferase
MLALPRTHRTHLADASDAEITAVGLALRTALQRLRAALGEVSYNLVFHTAPHRHGGPYHWHVHVAPRLTSIPGFEQGTGVAINVVPPEQAARRLTDAATV